MLGNTIGMYRRKLGLTQEQLAQKLDVTNQAVSKWESDQCCPDVALLPKLADALGISLDILFGRPAPEQPKPQALPWEDDGDFHIVVYSGHRLLGHSELKPDLTFTYEGPVCNVSCDLNLSCGNVQGNVTAGGYVECDEVAGNITAGGYVECDEVAGAVSAGAYVECGDVGGNVMAGAYVESGAIDGNVTAGTYVECDEICGTVLSGGPVSADDEDPDDHVIITINQDGKGKFSMDFLKDLFKD